MPALPDSRRRSDEDARLQRLANLSIEIRMLTARAQAAFEEHQRSAAGAYVLDTVVPAKRTAPGDPSCPHCGHTAGLSLLPREYRRVSTLVRCFACQQDSAAFDWVANPTLICPARRAEKTEIIPASDSQWSLFPRRNPAVRGWHERANDVHKRLHWHELRDRHVFGQSWHPLWKNSRHGRTRLV